MCENRRPVKTAGLTLLDGLRGTFFFFSFQLSTLEKLKAEKFICSVCGGYFQLSTFNFQLYEVFSCLRGVRLVFKGLLINIISKALLYIIKD
jgi:hypothetical protein